MSDSLDRVIRDLQHQKEQEALAKIRRKHGLPPAEATSSGRFTPEQQQIVRSGIVTVLDEVMPEVVRRAYEMGHAAAVARLSADGHQDLAEALRTGYVPPTVTAIGGNVEVTDQYDGQVNF